MRQGHLDPTLHDIPGYWQQEYLHDTITDALWLADIVIGRAGATTLAELEALNKPAVLIPLPASVRVGPSGPIFLPVEYEPHGFGNPSNTAAAPATSPTSIAGTSRLRPRPRWDPPASWARLFAARGKNFPPSDMNPADSGSRRHGSRTRDEVPPNRRAPAVYGRASDGYPPEIAGAAFGCPRSPIASPSEHAPAPNRTLGSAQ